MISDVDLHHLYEARTAAPSDINEHLQVLAGLAYKCRTVVEFGTRSGNSTVALLRGLAGKFEPGSRLETVDVDPNAAQHVAGLLDPDDTGKVAGVAFAAAVGNTLALDLPVEADGFGPDMIFIDTLHTYEQLKQELIRHGNKARKYLAFHDTETFGLMGEDGSSPGLRQAISEFILHSRRVGNDWRVVEDRKNNNGLMVLERHSMKTDSAGNADPADLVVGSPKPEAPTEDPKVATQRLAQRQAADAVAHAALGRHLGGGGAYALSYKGTEVEAVVDVQVGEQTLSYTGKGDSVMAALAGALTAIEGHQKALTEALARLRG